MRYLSLTSVLLLLVMFVTGCSEEAAPTAALNDSFENPTPPSLNKKGPVVASASGAWTIAGVRVIAFTARQHADGTVAGQWQRVNQPGTANHGDVVCLNITGNQARIGTIARSGPFAGQEGGFRAVDNGEGSNAAPDQVSLQFVNLGPGGAAAYCAGAPAGPPLNNVGAGNVQIR